MYKIWVPFHAGPAAGGTCRFPKPTAWAGGRGSVVPGRASQLSVGDGKTKMVVVTTGPKRISKSSRGGGGGHFHIPQSTKASVLKVTKAHSMQGIRKRVCLMGAVPF